MRIRPVSAALTVALLAASGAWLAAAGPGRGEPRDATIEIGRRLFFEETFRGNGRTCATCHDPIAEFSISPAIVQQRFAQDPTHPLFRALDSNDGKGEDFSNLLNHALVTVRIPLHERVFLPDDAARRAITVWRSTPTIANVALTAPYLWDGRSGNLQDQAAEAIATHMQPGRAATRRELDAIARFQEEMFQPMRIRALLDPNDAALRPRGFSVRVESPAAEFGQFVFDQHCTRCHALDLGHRSITPGEPIFVQTFVSDVNRIGLPKMRLGFLKPDGTVSIVETPDPGRAALTGDMRDLNAFEIPMLRGLKHTAPYFHDNSARTLGEVVDHYNQFFGFRILGQDRDDLITFLELL